MVIRFRKEVASLPVTLDADTLYAVRRGIGFDLYITDSTGQIAHKVNNTDDPLKSPQFAYDTAGNLSGITYADGSTKALTYTAGKLTQTVLTRGALVVTKTFAYDTNGILTGITQA